MSMLYVGLASIQRIFHLAGATAVPWLARNRAAGPGANGCRTRHPAWRPPNFFQQDHHPRKRRALKARIATPILHPAPAHGAKDVIAVCCDEPRQTAGQDAHGGSPSPFSVRNTASQVAQSLPLGPARWQTSSLAGLQRKKFWLLPVFCACAPRGLCPQGLRAASRKRRSAQAQKPGPLQNFSVAARLIPRG